MTQAEKILRHMEEHGSITPVDALREYGCMRLASRICDIKRAGVDVTRETRRASTATASRYGMPGIDWGRDNE